MVLFDLSLGIMTQLVIEKQDSDCIKIKGTILENV